MKRLLKEMSAQRQYERESVRAIETFQLKSSVNTEREELVYIYISWEKCLRKLITRHQRNS